MKTRLKDIKILQGDKVIWSIYIILILISMFSVASAINNAVINKAHGSFMPLIAKHGFMLTLGFCCCFFFHKTDVNKYSRYNKIFMYVSIALLVAPLIFYWPNISEARWLGFTFFRFQPSEIAKYVLIFYLCKQMDVHKNDINDTNLYNRLLGLLVLVCGLIFLPNFSTSVMVFFVCFFLLLAGGINKKKWIITFLLVLALLALGLVIIKTSPQILSVLPRGQTWANRVNNYGGGDVTQITQSNQARMAIAAGGFWGRFFGNSVMSPFLDEGHNDFIFAIMLEEGGIIWCFFILFLYFVLFARIFNVSKQADTIFESLLCLGIASMIAVQTIINMTVTVGIIPVTGQTLPFISYGGTSFVITSSFLGMVINISAKNKKRILLEKQKDAQKQQVNKENDSQTDFENQQEVLNENGD